MLRSLVARLLMCLYDAADTLYHHIVAIDNKKMKKAKGFGCEDSREKDFNVQARAVKGSGGKEEAESPLREFRFRTNK
jgi:hypothetical protein